MEENRAEKIKQELLNLNGNEIGLFVYVDHDDLKETHEETYYAGTPKEVEFSNKYGIPFPKREYRRVSIDYDSVEKYSAFRIDYLTLPQRNGIEKEIARREALKQIVNANPEKYSVLGNIEIDGVQISVTQKELIDAGIDPQLFGWVSSRENDIDVLGMSTKEAISVLDLTELEESGKSLQKMQTEFAKINTEDIGNRIAKAIEGESSLILDENDTLDDNTNKKEKLTRIKGKLERIEREIEGYIEKILGFDLNSLKLKIENKKKELENQFPLLDTTEIETYEQKDMMSIKNLLEEIGMFSEEIENSQLLIKLQTLLENCRNQIKIIQSRHEALAKKTDEIKEKEIRDILFSNQGSEIGLRINGRRKNKS